MKSGRSSLVLVQLGEAETSGNCDQSVSSPSYMLANGLARLGTSDKLELHQSVIYESPSIHLTNGLASSLKSYAAPCLLWLNFSPLSVPTASFEFGFCSL